MLQIVEVETETVANKLARMKAIETVKPTRYWPENGKFKVEFDEQDAG